MEKFEKNKKKGEEEAFFGICSVRLMKWWKRRGVWRGLQVTGVIWEGDIGLVSVEFRGGCKEWAEREWARGGGPLGVGVFL